MPVSPDMTDLGPSDFLLSLRVLLLRFARLVLMIVSLKSGVRPGITVLPSNGMHLRQLSGIQLMVKSADGRLRAQGVFGWPGRSVEDAFSVLFGNDLLCFDVNEPSFARNEQH